MKFSTRDLCFCAIGAALIAVCAWISIPADVPFTLQTFAIFTVCGLLGGKRGTVSVLVYLLLGAVGAPVFAGFRGGFASLLGTTGGYLVGFASVVRPTCAEPSGSLLQLPPSKTPQFMRFMCSNALRAKTT